MYDVRCTMCNYNGNSMIIWGYWYGYEIGWVDCCCSLGVGTFLGYARGKGLSGVEEWKGKGRRTADEYRKGREEEEEEEGGHAVVEKVVSMS